jgi:hypothetical protein
MIDPKKWREYGTEIRERANISMREMYLSSDANLGSEILKARKKALSSGNMFTLLQSWSPIAFLSSRPGLQFEISEISMMSMGESALDPEIDETVMNATIDVISEDFEGMLSTLIQGAVDGPSEYFEVKDSR